MIKKKLRAMKFMMMITHGNSDDLLLMVMMMTTHDNSDGNVAIIDGHDDDNT